VQYIRFFQCRIRFLKAMDAVAQKISESKWKDRVVFCFIGWEAFGKFAPENVPFITKKAAVIELTDWDIHDEVVIETLARALAISDDARAAVRIVMERSGGQPQTTCILLDTVRMNAELNQPPITYTQAAERLIIQNPDIHLSFDLLQSTAEHYGGIECLKKLLRTPQGREEFDGEPPSGMDALLMAGIVRKKGNVYEVKSPMLLDWFRMKYQAFP
jgi:hypothetical protein